MARWGNHHVFLGFCERGAFKEVKNCFSWGLDRWIAVNVSKNVTVPAPQMIIVLFEVAPESMPFFKKRLLVVVDDDAASDQAADDKLNDLPRYMCPLTLIKWGNITMFMTICLN